MINPVGGGRQPAALPPRGAAPTLAQAFGQAVVAGDPAAVRRHGAAWCESVAEQPTEARQLLWAAQAAGQPLALTALARGEASFVALCDVLSTSTLPSRDVMRCLEAFDQEDNTALNIAMRQGQAGAVTALFDALRVAMQRDGELCGLVAQGFAARGNAAPLADAALGDLAGIVLAHRPAAANSPRELSALAGAILADSRANAARCDTGAAIKAFCQGVASLPIPAELVAWLLRSQDNEGQAALNSAYEHGVATAFQAFETQIRGLVQSGARVVAADGAAADVV